MSSNHKSTRNGFAKINNEKVWEQWNTESVLVTANKRLSRHLQQRYIDFQRQRGLTVWPTATILPLELWLQLMVKEGILSGHCPTFQVPHHILGESESLLLWQQTIENIEAERPLLASRSMARSAMEAWQMIVQWQVPLDEYRNSRFNQTGISCDHISEFQALRRWITAYRTVLQNKRWVDYPLLCEIAHVIAKSNTYRPPAQLFLTGFDELTPLYSKFFETLSFRGCRVVEVLPQNSSATGALLELEDFQSECRHAAQWCYQKISQNPKQRIAIVIPDLRCCRMQLERVFDQAFYPHCSYSPDPKQQKVYNISLGVSLSEAPLVKTALRVLSFLGSNKSVEVEQFTFLLLNPFLPGFHQEHSQRSNLDLILRELDQVTVSVATIEKLAYKYSPLFAHFLKGFRTEYAQLESLQMPPSSWSQALSNLLKKSGWPGDRPLNSEEYQTLVKWNECLHSFSRLDPLVTVLDFATAVDLLHTTTRETTFQPESPGEAPIQIMGLLEAGGNHYDALWALGMHDENWPPTPRPNPLIPVVIQRLHNLPRSSAARELQYAQALTSRLLDSADDIIFSYPQRDGDRALRPSPLLQALVKTTPSEQEITIPLSVWENHQGSAPINELNDNYGPRLTSINLKGGASFFKDQSACPFRGYALHRLRADAPKTPTPGISPRIRGTLLHYALELIWKTLENSCRLHQTCDNDLTQLIDRSLQTATQKLLQYRNIEPCPLKLELQVLKLWLQEWMKLEASRPQFSVLCLEKTCELQVGELLVNLKIDRIDQSHQHKGNILIDYKSSDNSRPAQWIGPRPEEPQMLLYAAKLKSSVCGLAYGVINRDHSEFRGLARDDNILPNVGVDLKNFDFSSWEILIQQWSHELEQLAGEIQSGAATITPARGKLTCRYCPLSLLCRIDCNGELDTNLDHE